MRRRPPPLRVVRWIDRDGRVWWRIMEGIHLLPKKYETEEAAKKARRAMLYYSHQ